MQALHRCAARQACSRAHAAPGVYGHACMLAHSRVLACTPACAIDPKALDVARLSEMMELQPASDEQRYSIDRIAGALGENVGVVKNMVFKKRGLLNFQPDEIKSKIQQLADIVEVPYETAKRMAVIQPGLFFETDKQAQVLKGGIRTICYELNMPKDEVVNLIVENPSVLHGRQLHLSVADMAHLAIIREPKGRIVD